MSGPSEMGRPLVPRNELPCVWMTAGILSYQLCERRLECERCPLDQAMRAHFRRDRPQRGNDERPVESRPARSPATGPGQLREDRLYGREHCWVMRLGEARGPRGRVRVGLEPGLAAALHTPRAVVQDELGSLVRPGEPHVWIVTEGGTFGVPAPLAGTLDDVNEGLRERPSLASSDPLDRGWLFDLRVAEDAIEGARLLDAPAAAGLYEADAERFRHEIRSALDAQSPATPVMQDGGVPLQSIADMLGPSRYFRLVRRVYGMR